ncbi:hypothetical protein H0H92_006755, partial [Tricholoma furcatifolium]
NDNEESDFEILTSTAVTASADVGAGIWATNQLLVAGGAATHALIPFEFDPSEAFREYRIDVSFRGAPPRRGRLFQHSGINDFLGGRPEAHTVMYETGIRIEVEGGG